MHRINTEEHHACFLTWSLHKPFPFLFFFLFFHWAFPPACCQQSTQLSVPSSSLSSAQWWAFGSSPSKGVDRNRQWLHCGACLKYSEGVISVSYASKCHSGLTCFIVVADSLGAGDVGAFSWSHLAALHAWRVAVVAAVAMWRQVWRRSIGKHGSLKSFLSIHIKVCRDFHAQSLPCLLLSGQLQEVLPLVAMPSSLPASSSSSLLPQTLQPPSTDSRHPCNADGKRG